FFQAEDGIRDVHVTGVQTCALPISGSGRGSSGLPRRRPTAPRAPAHRRSPGSCAPPRVPVEWWGHLRKGGEMSDWIDGRIPPEEQKPTVGQLVERLSEQATRLVRSEIA